MRRVESREYKVMLLRDRFADFDAGIENLRQELRGLAQAAQIQLRKRFKLSKLRSIQFFDTPGRVLEQAGLILRQRGEDDRSEFTLKFRSPDRSLASSTGLSPGEGLQANEKFEEDIAAPFRSRFSHSSTIRPKRVKPLRRVSDAIRLFPGLEGLGQDEAWLDEPLEIVNRTAITERVLEGPVIELPANDATVALIVWNDPVDQTLLLVELSFRYGAENERFKRSTVKAAYALYQAIQRSDWVDLVAETKTGFIFDGDAREPSREVAFNVS